MVRTSHKRLLEREAKWAFIAKRRCVRSWSRSAPASCATAGYVVFQLVEVAVPRSLFAGIPRRIDDLWPWPPPLPA
jgi:hypothetical protein